MQKGTKSIVIHGVLKSGAEMIAVNSSRWFEWLNGNDKFTFRGETGHFTAQCEIRRNHPYWYAYRRNDGKLSKVYLGKLEDLTLERLQQAATAMNGAATGPTADSSSFLANGRIDSSILPIAKVDVPILPRQMVNRVRLTQMITTPLTIVTAPSGFGKSTLLNEWRQICGFQVAWLSLDERDNHPQRFWGSVVAALQTVHSGIGKEFLLALQNYPTVGPNLLNQLNRDITQMGPFRLGLIVDDFQYIHHSEVFDSLQFWLDHLPANFQLIISGQTRPPLSLGYLRARGMLTEIDANHLRFTVEEGMCFLQNYAFQPPLNEADLLKLIQHNEGWAAGLTLTALGLNGQQNRQQFINTFGGGHIFFREFFLEAVLHHLTPEIQDFLLKTSILKHLSGSLCDAITGQTNGEDLLAHLRNENIFIVRLEQQGWYRYHNLFAEMLYSQLNTRYASMVPQLHRRAAQWFREHAAPADAIDHLLATQAWEEAALLIEEMALQELEQFGEDSRLLRWMDELPISVIQKHRTLLSIFLRLATTAYPSSKVEKVLSQIKANLQSQSVETLTADEQEVLVELSRFEEIWAQDEELAIQTHTRNAAEPRWALLDRLCIMRFEFSQYTKEVEQEFNEIFHSAMIQKNLFVVLMSGGSLSSNIYADGQLRKAEQISRQVIDYAMKQRSTYPEPVSIVLATLSQVYLERNDLESAERTLHRVVDVDPNPTSTNMTVLYNLIQSKIKISQKAPDGARQVIQALRELNNQRPSRLWKDIDLAAYEASACVMAGDWMTAEQILNDADDGAPHLLSLFAKAEIHLAKNELNQAQTCLTDLIGLAPFGINTVPLMYVRTLLALVFYKQNNLHQARLMLLETLRQAAPERFFRPFLIHSQDFIPLFLFVQQDPVLSREMKAFVKEALNLMGYNAQSQASSPSEIAAFSIAASISPREQEILRLVNDGLTNRAIAERLSICESTVKTHLSNIFCKLDVTSRFQAITYAKQLRLIN